ncbi:MAG: DUF2911 domain-containing protein [Gemmatimonadaceae bacterium]|nr:DUF2911 domain-containing protein [Chitinophagaceae bacterium]
MKRMLFFSTLVFMTLAACSQNPKPSPRVTAEGKDMKVAYGQPSKKGRVIFGGLEPYGKLWRTGANEATEITFAKDVVFGGQAVKAGTYTLFTVPGEKEWEVILNSQLGQNGAWQYDKYKDKDFVKVKVPAKKLDSVVEKLTLRFANPGLVIEWDETQVAVPITAK